MTRPVIGRICTCVGAVLAFGSVAWTAAAEGWTAAPTGPQRAVALAALLLLLSGLFISPGRYR